MLMTAQDMTARYDFRTLCRLCFDNDAQHYESELAESPILRSALDDAYGEFKAALSVAGMYDQEQLDRFTPESESLAKRIVCEIALAHLYSRRGGEARETVKELRAASEEYLDKLRKGERLFSFADNDTVKEEAGRPTLVAPTVVQLHNLNGVTHRARTYFGGVAERQHIKKF